jgi:hypothetical protein
MPSVDYISAAKTKAGVFDTVSNALDKMSEFAFEKQKARVELEGAAYGAANAPTKEQIDTAKKPISEMMQIDPTTVFGAAAKAAAAEQIEGRFLVRAGSELTQLRLDAKENNTDIEAFQGQVQNLIDGYSSILQGISPEAANKFAATLATKGNSAIISHNDDLIAAQEQQDDAAAAVGVDNILNVTLPEIFEVGVKLDANGNQIAIDDQVDALRDELITIAKTSTNSDTLIASKTKEFDEAVSNNKKSVVLSWVSEDRLGHARQLRENKVQDQNIANILGSLTEEERQDIIIEGLKVGREQMSFDVSVETQREKDRAAEALKVTVAIFKGRVSGTAPDEIRGMLKRLEALDPEKYIQVATAIRTEGGIDDSSVAGRLRFLQSQKQLTEEEILNAAMDRNISLSTLDTFFNALEKQRDDNYQQALDIARVHPAIGLPDKARFAIGGSEAERQRDAEQLFGQITIELDEARRENPNLNSIQWMKNRVKELDTGPDETQIRTARTRIGGLAQLLELPEDTDPADVQTALMEEIRKGNQKQSLLDTHANDFEILGSQ